MTLFVYDGESGAAITDASVTLQIGSQVETATVTNNTYTITGIPPGTFPITITKSGYLTFTSAQVTFSSNGSITSPTTVPGTFVYSVGMFPQQSVSTDMTVKVFDQGSGAPITTGQVVAILDSTETIAGQAGTGAATGNVKPLPGSVGFLPTSVTAQISSGTATLSKSQLVFGATYDIILVGATDAQGQFVSTSGPVIAVAGQTSNNQLVLFVSSANINPVAISANNEDPNAVVTSLDVTFPYPVQTCSDAATWSWSNNNSGTTTERPVASGNQVTITLPSPTVMRVTPNIDVTTITTGDKFAASFSGISIEVAGSSRCTNLGSVSLRNTAADVSLTIHVAE